MVSWSDLIIHPDDKFEIEEWIITMCDLNYEDYQSNNNSLTKEMLEGHLENIVKHLPKHHYLDYIVLGAFLIEVGAEIPDYVKYRIVESINFEMKNESRLRTINTKKSRKIFYTDYKDKILHYQGGQKTFLIHLKLKNDSELDESIFGIEEFQNKVVQEKIQNIKYINLDGSKLDNVPSEIENFQELKILSLEYNRLESIPETIYKLENLEFLYLNGNLLDSISNNISHLSNLKRLNLAYNNLISLPEAIGYLYNLEELYLYNNNLKIIPHSLGNLEHLGLINLENNPIESIPNNLIPSRNFTGCFHSEAQYQKAMKERKK